ncbi:MAG: efflux RND transporter periplasmic adaptor subunit [Candidatus Fermentibacteraceae bacterium]
MRIPAAFVLFYLAFLSGCSAGENASTAPIEVETLSLSPSEIRMTIEFSALLEPGSEAFLVSPGGVLLLIAVCEGDSVKAGDIIAVLSGDAALSRTAAAAEEELRAALAGAERAANDAARITELHEAGAVSETALLGALANSTAAEAAVDGARYARAAAVAGERTGILKAPFEGIVGTVRGRSGMFSPPGDIVASVLGQGLMVRLLVPERHLLEIRPGMTSVFQPALGEYPPLEGTVESVARSVDPLTGLIAVTVLFSATGDSPVRPGVSGVVFIEVALARGAVVIPADAVVIAGTTLQVPVLLDDGTVDFRDVEVGIQSGDSIQVVSGLEFGEEVILRSSSPLSRGVGAVRAGS